MASLTKTNSLDPRRAPTPRSTRDSTSSLSMARTDAMVRSQILTHPIPRHASTPKIGEFCFFILSPTPHRLGYATTPWLKNTHTRLMRQHPQPVWPEPPRARGLHPQVRSRAPASKTKISWTILPESPEGSGAPVGFINSGSLGDRLPRQGSAQENGLSFFWTGPKV